MNDDTAIASLKDGADGMKAFQTGIMDMIKETVIPANSCRWSCYWNC